jgi:hypothetical protein
MSEELPAGSTEVLSPAQRMHSQGVIELSDNPQYATMILCVTTSRVVVVVLEEVLLACGKKYLMGAEYAGRGQLVGRSLLH